MDETLSARVIGDLTGDQPLDRHEAALVDRGIDFDERFAQQNGVEPRTWPTYQRLLREKHLNDGLRLGRNGQFDKPQRPIAWRFAKPNNWWRLTGTSRNTASRSHSAIKNWPTC